MKQTSSTMSIPEVWPENQSPIMEKMDEQKIKGEYEEMINFPMIMNNILGLPVTSTGNYPSDDSFKLNLQAHVAAELEQKFKVNVDCNNENNENIREYIIKKLLESYLSDDVIKKIMEASKIMEGSQSPNTVIKINEQNEAVDEDPYMAQNHFTLHKKYLKHDITIWATFYSGQIAIACCLGNPFDKLSKLGNTSTKMKEQSLMSFGEAISLFLPCIILSAMFFLNFIYTIILTRLLAFRGPANSMLLLLLVYYIFALAEAVSGSGVLWGSLQLSALLFVCGGATVLMMLTGSIIKGTEYYFSRMI